MAQKKLPSVLLRAGEDRRVRAGHPWAFSNEILMDAETKALPPGRVHVEYFAARESAATEGGFTVELARSHRSVAVPPGHTILDCLEEIGIEFRDDEEALALWKQAGADVRGQRVHFPKGLCRELLKTAPSSFTWHARNHERSVQIGGKATVLMDGGVRRGSDIVKALASGAEAVMIGRATYYGVCAGGQAGAQRALDILSDELIRTMQLCGVKRVADIGPDLLAK